MTSEKKLEILEKLRDSYRKAADLIDEFFALMSRAKDGENVEEDACALVVGKYYLTMTDLREALAEIREF